MTKAQRTRKLVVAAVMISTDGRELLISKRRPDQALPDRWELPGGKIEPGEAPEQALRRELREELGVEVRVGRIWDTLFHAYPEYDVLMLVYPCQVVGAEPPRCVEVADLAWVEPAQLGSYDLLEADRPLCQRLEDEGVPTAWLLPI